MTINVWFLLPLVTCHHPPQTFFSSYTFSLQEPFDIIPTNPILAEGWRKFMASCGLCSHVLHALQVNTARCPSCLNHFNFSRITPACCKKRRKMSLNRLGLLLRPKKGVQMCLYTASKLSHFKTDGQLPLKCINTTVRGAPWQGMDHPVSLGGVPKPM